MDGFELSLRFAYMPNQLRFCGPKEAHESFISYLNGNGDEKAVAGHLKRFEGLYPYLSAIAAKSGMRFTDYEVVEAYWLGNGLLGLFGDDDVKAAIMSLIMGGLPRSIAESRSANLPSGMVPHHNFNVFYVGVGQVTGAVPTTIGNMNSCMVSQGRVKEVQDDKLLVSRKLLEFNAGRFVFGNETDVEAAYLPLMLDGVGKGDTVAMHWGFSPLVLTAEQSANLSKYTERIMRILNESGTHPLATASL